MDRTSTPGCTSCLHPGVQAYFPRRIGSFHAFFFCWMPQLFRSVANQFFDRSELHQLAFDNLLLRLLVHSLPHFSILGLRILWGH
ncbi:hypothetical protein [Bacteroides sedimenti]|uniref:hypothetical protein n=1 Tax=Bacteroides sedimenti TaxID=2136147 RepID=UPI0033416967